MTLENIIKFLGLNFIVVPQLTCFGEDILKLAQTDITIGIRGKDNYRIQLFFIEDTLSLIYLEHLCGIPEASWAIKEEYLLAENYLVVVELLCLHPSVDETAVVASPPQPEEEDEGLL